MRALSYENGAKAVAEQTPLLAETAETAAPSLGTGAEQRYDSANTNTNRNTTGQNDGNGDNDALDDKPLPVWQVAVLCYARWVEPIAFFSILPYINQMVRFYASCVSKRALGD